MNKLIEPWVVFLRTAKFFRLCHPYPYVAILWDYDGKTFCHPTKTQSHITIVTWKFWNSLSIHLNPPTQSSTHYPIPVKLVEEFRMPIADSPHQCSFC